MSPRRTAVFPCLAIGTIACDAGIPPAAADGPPAPLVLPESALPLRWSLSEKQLDAVVRNYQLRYGDPAGTLLDEITVQSPLAPLKMRDLSQDIWTGPAAPFWALIHPTQSWRIFLPVPPGKELPEEPRQEP